MDPVTPEFAAPVADAVGVHYGLTVRDHEDWEARGCVGCGFAAVRFKDGSELGPLQVTVPGWSLPAGPLAVQEDPELQQWLEGSEERAVPTTADDGGMTENMAEVVERFTRAVQELVIGSGTLEQRLAEAWVHVLTIRAIDLPEPLQQRFRTMESVWLSIEPRDLTEDARKMAARELLSMQVEIVDLVYS